MNDTCSYPVDRDETLIAYLYDDIDPVVRATFDAHLTTCASCRDELEALRGVRTQLASWAPPEPRFAFASTGTSNAERRTSNWERRTPNAERRTPRWRNVPTWAQVAAAVLFLGVAAGMANLDVRYDANGLTVRTGWLRPAGPPSAPAAAGPARPEQPAATRADLAALEQQLRSELRAVQASEHATAAAGAPPSRGASDAEVLRRVRALLDDSEKRQQRELALRIGEMWRDVNAQRQADLVRIDRSLGVVGNRLGAEVLKQRQSINLLISASQGR